MVIIVLIAFFQLVLFPGLLCLRFLRYNGPPLRIAVFSFGASLVINYTAVFVLTSLGWYTRTPVLACILAETVVLLLLFRAAITNWIFSSSLSRRLFRPVLLDLRVTIRSLGTAGAIVALCVVLVKFQKNVGSIFTGWDSVVSWNRWALDWFQNRLPVQTWHYPQLLPANWSLSYVILNEPLQFVAKAMMPLFMLGQLLIGYDLGKRHGSLGYFVSVPVILILFRGLDMTDGYADIPVAFFSLLTVHCLLLARTDNDPGTCRQHLFLSAVFAAAAAVTKQAGLFIVVLYPVLCYVLVLRALAWSARQKMLLLLVALLLIALVAAPFYVYAQMQIMRGLDSSEVEWVTKGIHGGRSFAERIVHALHLLTASVAGKYLLILLGTLSLFSLKEREMLSLLALIVVPFFAVWALFFSYDVRNVAIALPFFGLTVGKGVERIISYAQALPEQNLDRVRNLFFVLFLLLMVIVANRHFSRERLATRHGDLERGIGDGQLNRLLYDYQKKNQLTKKIVTNYQLLGHLPGLKEHYRLQIFYPADGDDKMLTADYLEYRKAYEDTGVGHILIIEPALHNPKIVADLRQRIASGQVELIMDSNEYLFIRIKGRT